MDNKDLEKVSGGVWLTDADANMYRRKGYKLTPTDDPFEADTNRRNYRVTDGNGSSRTIPDSKPDYTLRDAYLRNNPNS